MTHGDITVTVDPLNGGRLASLTVRGREVLVTAAPSPLDWGCYPMVPYAGRVADARFVFAGTRHDLRPNAFPHSIHGTVCDSPWELEHRDASSIVMSTTLGDHWPFSATVVHSIRVVDNAVQLHLAVHPDEDQPMQVGWHPWFLKPRHLTTSFSTMYERDSRGLTTDRNQNVTDGPWDDCFTHMLSNPTLRVNEIELSLNSDCSHWVIFDMPAHATCVEPQSGPPNAFSYSPEIVHRGELFARWFTIAVV